MRIAIAGGTGTVGRHVVGTARERSHDVVLLTRSAGHDLVRGDGLEAALAGVDAVIDVTGMFTTAAKPAIEFFTAVTGNLLHAERAAGVGHHVVLSIVGIDGIDVGLYAAKLAQERQVAQSDVPWTLLRATQFHEFAEQVVHTASFGPITLVPGAPVRPVAAREVAGRLLDLAESAPSGRAPDLRGPRDEELPAMARRMLAADGTRRLLIPVSLPGRYWAGLRSGALRGDAGATEGSTTFDQWLAGPDHTRPAAQSSSGTNR